MIDFSGYTREVIQKEMLDQVDPNIDTREGSMIQNSDWTGGLVSGRGLHDLKADSG